MLEVCLISYSVYRIKVKEMVLKLPFETLVFEIWFEFWLLPWFRMSLSNGLFSEVFLRSTCGENAA